MSAIKVVSPLNSPFALAATLEAGLRGANVIQICSPWIERSFVDLIRRTVPKRAHLDILIRTPEYNDKTFRSLETFDLLRREMGWSGTSTCVPYLHAKFTVVNCRDVFFGSANATSNGLFYNNEVMMVFYNMPDLASRFVNIFECVRGQKHNLRWELARDFHGPSIEGRPAAIVMQYLEERREVRKDTLVKVLEGHRYDFRTAKEVVQRMLCQGILYEPRSDYVRLA